MYHETNKLSREGCSISYIADYLGINWRTVKRYLSLNEREYELFLASQLNRFKILAPYEHFVKSKLDKYPETSAAQIHDWLKEYDDTFPEVHPKTVYNFVMYIRQNYLIPKNKHTRDFHPVEELPFGQQAQVDFGQYNMRTSTGKTKKVHFMITVLSRSRYKHIYFSDTPFTALLAIDAHEKAFEMFNGVPKTMVYDQDTVFIKSENSGDLILTHAFKNYVTLRGFASHFCRKADPQSKGKVENIVRYVKQNFLYNRTFLDLNTLNDEAMAWLYRTANHLEHGKTKLSPREQWMKEKEYLKTWEPLHININPSTLYTVRKDNSISYKGNLYSLPLGTWQGKGSQVLVCLSGQTLIINKIDGSCLCTYEVSQSKGQTIINNNHKRDKSLKIDQLIIELAPKFEDRSLATLYFQNIKRVKPRYIRDQLAIIDKCFDQFPVETLNKCLIQCFDHKIFSASDFSAVANSIYKETGEQISDHSENVHINLLPGGDSEKIKDLKPLRSQIKQYDSIINKQ